MPKRPETTSRSETTGRLFRTLPPKEQARVLRRAAEDPRLTPETREKLERAAANLERLKPRRLTAE
jgi:hypothetical protein